MKYLFLALLLVTCCVVYAQHTLQGTITDAVSHKPIPYASVGIKGTPRGTITNDEGNFTLSAANLPVTISVSHVSYESTETVVTDEKSVNILLKPRSTTLREVIIGDEALLIIKRASTRAAQNADSVYDANMFFRQSITTSKKLNFFSESFLDVQWQNSGLTRYGITNSRYLERPGGITNRNMAAFSLLSCGFTKNIDVMPELVFPLNDHPDVVYKFTLKEHFMKDGGQIAIINCEPKHPDNGVSYFKGDYYIDTQNYGIVKIDGTITNFNLKSPNYTVFVEEVKFISQFKFIKGDVNVLDYSSLTIKADYSPGAFKAFPMVLQTTLYAIDYQLVNRSKLQRINIAVKPFDTDQQRFKRVRYFAEFWKQNEIIKRTPQEEAAVKQLEKDVDATGNLNLY